MKVDRASKPLNDSLRLTMSDVGRSQYAEHVTPFPEAELQQIQQLFV